MKSCSSCKGKFKKDLHPWHGMLLCERCYKAAIARHGPS